MNTFESQPHPPAAQFAPPEVYDPDDVIPRSPLLQPMRPKLEPDPSPPLVLPVPDSKRENGVLKEEERSNLSDGVLVHFMSDGKHRDLEAIVSRNPLPPPPERVQVIDQDGRKVLENSDRPGNRLSNYDIKADSNARMANQTTDRKAKDVQDLAARAVEALNQSKEATPPHTNGTSDCFYKAVTPSQLKEESIEEAKPSLPSIIVERTEARPILDMPSQTGIHNSQAPALAPLQTSTYGNNTVTLPPISDLKKLADTPRDTTAFSQSPPARAPLIFNSSHASPPKSPVDYRMSSSDGRNFFYQQNRRPSQAETPGSMDYNNSNAETPSDQSTPASTLGLNRMSIEGLTNPMVGGYKCIYEGCTAPPFQTQYLLNSHANVHSQNRPHYCSVKGCARSEGGKGFKRKNEMIRHGLVHASPGYVCPFCPDREHKYPRPDNLQRHVRVHHVDKDKDDPLLRDVLAQRLEGPSRGRRRRGTNG